MGEKTCSGERETPCPRSIGRPLLLLLLLLLLPLMFSQRYSTTAAGVPGLSLIYDDTIARDIIMSRKIRAPRSPPPRRRRRSRVSRLIARGGDDGAFDTGVARREAMCDTRAGRYSKTKYITRCLRCAAFPICIRFENGPPTGETDNNTTEHNETTATKIADDSAPVAVLSAFRRPRVNSSRRKRMREIVPVNFV